MSPVAGRGRRLIRLATKPQAVATRSPSSSVSMWRQAGSPIWPPRGPGSPVFASRTRTGRKGLSSSAAGSRDRRPQSLRESALLRVSYTSGRSEILSSPCSASWVTKGSRRACTGGRSAPGPAVLDLTGRKHHSTAAGTDLVCRVSALSCRKSALVERGARRHVSMRGGAAERR